MRAAPEVLFFSRGRGRGHAIPDIEVARELARRRPDLELRFASYATGAETLRAAGFSVIDMDLKEEPPYLEVLVRASRIISAHHPELVVSHEEFAVLPPAKALGLPTVMIVDFFAPVQIWADSLNYADEILFIERRGIFAEQPAFREKLRYVGPVVRSMAVKRTDRDTVRLDLKLSSDAKVLAIIPGAWANEQRAPIFDLVVPAFRQLPYKDKKLVWIAGADSDTLQARLAGDDEFVVLPEFTPIEKLMVASNAVVTKANRGTTIEASSLGIPSISLSFGLNPIDELIIARIRSNIALNARGADPDVVCEAIMEALAEQGLAGLAPSRDYRQGGAAAVAAELLRIVDALPSPADSHSRLQAFDLAAQA